MKSDIIIIIIIHYEHHYLNFSNYYSKYLHFHLSRLQVLVP